MTEQPSEADKQDVRDARQERREIAVADRIRSSHGALRLTALVVILFLINLFWSSHTATTAAQGREQIEAQALAAEQKVVTAQQKAIRAACDFWYPLTGLPVTLNEATGKPTELSVQLIVGARESYAGQCAGGRAILPADPTLVKWAAYYHLPVAS